MTINRRLAPLLILIASAACADEIRDVVARVGQSSYTHYLRNVLFTHDGDNRGAQSPQLEAARANIRDTFAGFGLTATLHPFQWQGGTFYNVVGMIEGKTRPAEFHILGAHYDSANNPGADDDASGVAALLECARVLSMYDFETSILFIAFDREEVGLVGSSAWANEHAADRILSMVQLDMIAFNVEPTYNMLALVRPDNLPNPLYSKFEHAVQQYSGGLIPVDGGVSARSDHASFAWLAPALEVIEASFYSNRHYHKVTDSVDTPGYIDYRFATGVTKSTVAYLASEAAMLPVDSTAARFSSAGIANAASWVFGQAAPSQLVSLIGSGLSAASGETTVTIRDHDGFTRPARLLYISPRQINLVMPDSLAAGPATITLTRSDGVTTSATVPVVAVAPGLFAANADGVGAAAAQAVRVAADGSQTQQNLFECEPVSGCRGVPVDFGANADRVIAVLYATGIRNRTAPTAVTVEIAGQKLPVEYAGAQPTYLGLDQVNVSLPRSLQGRGEVQVVLVVDGKASTPVTLHLGSPL